MKIKMAARYKGQEADQEQLKSILQRLIDLKEKKISLEEFTLDFPDRFDGLNIKKVYSQATTEWLEACNKEWWDLEIINAIYKSPFREPEKYTKLQKEFIAAGKDDIAINKAINKLIELVKSKIIKSN